MVAKPRTPIEQARALADAGRILGAVAIVAAEGDKSRPHDQEIRAWETVGAVERASGRRIADLVDRAELADRLARLLQDARRSGVVDFASRYRAGDRLDFSTQDTLSELDYLLDRLDLLG